MSKFQVVKTSPMKNKPDSKSMWIASMVKGLFTDDFGEVEMVEVMLFGAGSELPPTYKAGEQLTPIFQVRRNRSTNRTEFVIGSFTPVAKAA